MTDKFSTVSWEPAAADVLRRVKDEAAVTAHPFHADFHLMLAIVAVTSVEQHGFIALNRDSVLAAINAIVSPWDPDCVIISPGGQIPRLKLAIAHAMQRASAETRSVNCLDLWSGLLVDSESVCREVLHRLEIDVNALRIALKIEEPVAQTSDQ